MTLSANATVNFNTSLFAADSFISGNLNVGSGTCVFNVGGGGGLFQIPASVSGSATINKTGAGVMTLNSSNFFSGPLNIAVGQLAIFNSYALGSNISGTTVSNGAQLQLIGNLNISNEPLVMASSHPFALFVSQINNTSTWSGPITWAAPSGVYVASNSLLTLSGVLSGSGGIIKKGPNRQFSTGQPWFLQRLHG